MDGDALALVRASLPRLSAAEARVAEVILGDPTLVVDLAITDLARVCRTSLSTVARFAQSLGYSGYRELRVECARAVTRAQAQQERFGFDDAVIDLEDTAEAVVAKIAAQEVSAIEQTALAVDFAGIDRVASAVAAARHTELFGQGASALTAQDFRFKLARIGCSAGQSSDPHVAFASAALLSPGAVAIGISHSGETSETLRGLEIARATGATTVALTNAPESSITRLADVVLYTRARESPLRIAAMSSRIAQLALLDVLFVRVVQMRGGAAAEPLRLTRDAVAPKRG